MVDARIVSIGFLNALDLERLGKAFTSHIPLPEDAAFGDLLAQLDHVEITQSSAVILSKSEGESG